MPDETTPTAMIRQTLDGGASAAEVTDAIRAAFPHLTDDEFAEAFDAVAGALAAEARDA